MKTPTHYELIIHATNVRLGWTNLSTNRERQHVEAALRRWANEIKRSARFTLAIPHCKPSKLYFYRTRAEGQKHRRWLIKNIDLTPKCRVVKFNP